MAAPRKQLTFAECDALICQTGSEFEMIEVLENGHFQRAWKNVGKPRSSKTDDRRRRRSARSLRSG